MTNDEIRKLLGGYATNTLTEAERKSLFEAALENQELFDALQDEQALKELLADPVARAEARQALEKPRAVWWSRWWAWSGALTAVAAALVIVAVVREAPHPASPTVVTQAIPQSQPEQEARSAEPKPTSETVREQAARIPRIVRKGMKRAFDAVAPSDVKEARKDQKNEVAEASPPPPPLVEKAQAPPAAPQVVQQTQTPSPSQQQTQTQVRATANSSRDTEQAASVGGFRSSFAPTLPLRYSFLKRDASGAYSAASATELHSGDAIRLNVSAASPGYLILSRLDQSGVWKRIFPTAGPGMQVTPNASYLIPADSAIDLTGNQEKLRLTLLPAAAALTESLEANSKTKTMAKKSAAASATGTLAGGAVPLSVDITITPTKP